MHTMNTRAFLNPFPDYSGEQIATKAEDNNIKLDENVRENVKRSIPSLLQMLDHGLRQARRTHGDDSVYTGNPGVALLYLHMYDCFPEDGSRQNYLKSAMDYLGWGSRSKSGVPTFLCGDAGIEAIAAVLFDRMGDKKTSKECVQRLQDMHKRVVSDSGLPDEHLYGRAGYLAALMFVQARLGEDVISAEPISKVVGAMLASGEALSKKKGWKCPLMYRWYKEHYVGAAHGLGGIYYTLLMIKDPRLQPQIREAVQPCLNFLLEVRRPSGNFPPVVEESGDHLLHWCHGAPGLASLWALAYQVYNDGRYLEAAERCGDLTWQHGLLKKGYGLCHGASGNAYAFLALFRTTRDLKHLYRACKFAEWCSDYGSHGCRNPDNPYSLFEGLAGTIYFLCDLLDPLKARFPCYEF